MSKNADRTNFSVNRTEFRQNGTDFDRIRLNLASYRSNSVK
jgi:hypothetical protein